MKHNPVGWFEIYVQDMKKAKAFYEAVLQVKLEEYKFPELEMWGFPHAQGQSGAGGALVKMSGVQSGGNSTLVYFSCANCADEVGRVIKSGGRIFKDKFSIGEHGFIALAVDTEGNMFGLHSMK
jgi:predicted enzyme related to lactoylglutathione lyase